MVNLEDEIPEGHPAGLCPICDNALEAWEETVVVTAHGNKYLVHAMCLAEDDDEDECPVLKEESTIWRIHISGYGTFDFDGTESKAEDMRKHKCVWEQGFGLKWRADLLRESDRLTAKIAGMYDNGERVPSELFDKRRDALLKELEEKQG